MTNRILAVACILAGATGCRQQTADTRTRAELDSALIHYDSLVRRMAVDSIAATYTPDGEMLGTNAGTVTGPDSIRKFLGQFSQFRVDTQEMRVAAVELFDAEAVQWGTWKQATTVPAQGMVHVQGRFVAHWVRGTDGRWRLRRLLTQPTPP
ncbi:MAG TPA: hypothetical protein VGI92_12165 [Gemmatimonadales bacterium]